MAVNYSSFADEFDKTRVALWPGVCAFLDLYGNGKGLVLDLGCGNGKYMNVKRSWGEFLGIDLCWQLLNIVNNKTKKDVVMCNLMQPRLPFVDGGFDCCICVAVLHHLPFESDRIGLVKEMLRAVNGMCCVVVWASTAVLCGGDKWKPCDGRGDWLVSWGSLSSRKRRFYHLFEDGELEDTIVKAGGRVVRVFFEADNWYCWFNRGLQDKNTTIS